jgi:hypothetical protein
MSISQEELVTGIVMAMIFSNALMFSFLFRNIALALAAGAITMAFVHGDGVLGIMSVSQLMVDQYNSHPDFGRGALLGIITAASIGCRFIRLRSFER